MPRFISIRLSAFPTDDEVPLRWIAVYPPRTLDVDDPDTVRMWVEHEYPDMKMVNGCRQRLQGPG